MAQEDVFKKIVSHCKEYGFVFPSSDIYDGLAAVYDYGQNGVELKNNIKQYWWQSMVLLHSNIVGIDASIFMHPTVWKASGHVDAFNDPLIDNRDSKKRYRADNLIEDEGINNILEWNFNELLKNGSTKEEIKENLSYENYIKFDFNVGKDFFDSNFLGFSYLVPLLANDKEQQKFYSKVFRSINIQGESLLALESRAALYYLDKDLEDYFIPNFIEKIYVNDSKVDFVRYLALLSQYKKDKTADELGKKFAGKMEKYYEEYIYFTVGEEDSNIFIKYSEVFKDKKEYEKMYINLKESLKKLELLKKYGSIIDVDITLFGLIYFIVFEKKEIDYSKKESIIKEINKEIEKIKREDTKHVKNPAAFKYLRYRVRRSIEIYERYIK